MRKFIMITAACCIPLVMSFAYAENPKIQTKPSPAIHQKQNELIFLYAAPNDQTLLRKVAANAPLVPIFRQGEWLKVGDRATGDVGWVNQKQVQQARENFYRPEVQTFFVNVEHDNQGKPIINIVAYKNGKKLSEQQAREMYDKIRHQQQQEFQSMQRFNEHMNRMIYSNFKDTQQIFKSMGFNSAFPILEPVFIYQQVPASVKEKQINHQAHHDEKVQKPAIQKQ